ncbi:MAG TPA: hypothetical protein VFO34_08605 [Candidatus Acidoferrales bacterium]|nr:hypothetical protein [Candidatus Acidoferrales bacterium]
MNPRRIGIAFAAVGLAALCALASEPWKQKSFEKWTAADVRQVLQNSPWAKASKAPYVPQLNGDKPEGGVGVKIGTVPDVTLSDTPVDATHATLHPDTTVVIRWNSSLTVRRALYRDAVLAGEKEADAAERFLNTPPENIEFVMTAAADSLLPPIEPSSLEPETFLLMSPSGMKIPAKHAKVHQETDVHGRTGYIFEFPRTRTDGSSIVAEGTSYIEFQCRMGARMFRARFKPADMVGADGADLR